jgi:hypothetical protein
LGCGEHCGREPLWSSAVPELVFTLSAAMRGLPVGAIFRFSETTRDTMAANTQRKVVKIAQKKTLLRKIPKVKPVIY